MDVVLLVIILRFILNQKITVTIVDGLNVNNLFSFNEDNNNNEFYRKVLNNRLDLLSNRILFIKFLMLEITTH